MYLTNFSISLLTEWFELYNQICHICISNNILNLKVFLSLVLIVLQAYRCSGCAADRGDNADNYSAHDYMNACIGLHRMMSQLGQVARNPNMPQTHYDTPYSGFHHQNDAPNDATRHKRPTSAPCFDHEEYESFHGLSRLNSRAPENKRPASHAFDQSAPSRQVSESIIHSHPKMMRQSSKRSCRTIKDFNLRRLTRCLSTEEEDELQDGREPFLNNTEVECPVQVIQTNLAKRHNSTRVSDKDAKTQMLHEKRNSTTLPSDFKPLTTEKRCAASHGSLAESVLNAFKSEVKESVSRPSSVFDSIESSRVNSVNSHEEESKRNEGEHPTQDKPTTEPIYTRPSPPQKAKLHQVKMPARFRKCSGDKPQRPSTKPQVVSKPAMRKPPPPIPAYTNDRNAVGLTSYVVTGSNGDVRNEEKVHDEQYNQSRANSSPKPQNKANFPDLGPESSL